MKEIVDTETRDSGFKTETYVRTDDGTTYVFEQLRERDFAQLVRRGEGPEGRRNLNTTSHRLPKRVRQAADMQWGEDGWRK